jgi:hypothetical protein
MAATLAGWHEVYVTVGAAAGTLVGLLFVGLSLHIRVVVEHAEVRSLARVTLTAFSTLLLVAIAVLQPTDSALVVADWLAAIGLVSLVLTVRPLRDALVRGSDRALGLRTIMARFGVSGLGFLGILACAILMASGRPVDALSLLLIVIVLLLVVSVRNTWDLLVTVAASPAVDDR